MSVTVNVIVPTNGYLIERSSETPERITLGRDVVYHLAKACRRIRVLSGVAWITWAGNQNQDILLKAGDSLDFVDMSQDRVISALGHAPLVFEIDG